MNRILMLLFVCLPAIASFAQTSSGRPWIIAHRGGNAANGENSLSAFISAGEAGYDAIELDVRLTADNRLAVMHDATLNRTTNAKGRLCGMDMKEVAQARINGSNENVPELSEILAHLYGKIIILIEMKATGDDETRLAAATASYLSAYPSGKIIVQSFSQTALDHFSKLCPEIQTARLYVKPGGEIFRCGSNMDEAKTQSKEIAAVHHRFATRKFIRKMHGSGGKVFVWTVNSRCRMKRMLRRGVDGIITDRPEVLQKILNSTE